jgi:hypothetical protein
MRGDHLVRQWYIIRAIEASPDGLTLIEIAQREETGFRFFLPMEQENPNDTVWSITRILLDNIGEPLVAPPSHGLNSRPVAPTGT